MGLHFLSFTYGVILFIYQYYPVHAGKLAIMALFLFVLYFCVGMKRLYTYTLSTLLAVSVMLASAGVPLIAHMCNMGCKKEISVVASDNCCKEKHTDSAAPHLKKGPCCDSKTFFLKQELPARKVVKSAVPEQTVASSIFVAVAGPVILSYTPFQQKESPPLLYGRGLLNHIHVLRT